MLSFLTKVFGSKNDREVKRMQPVVDRINALEAGMQAMSDEDLRAQTGRFRERLANGEPLDDLLPEAFAVVREASVRALKMRHFDVQLIGGMVLHEGKIAEMKTGEGKTLVATLPVYLNALAGKGVHVVTVNDYLARRDAEWMGRIYRFLGLSVGVILHGLDGRRAAGGLRGRHHLRHQQRVRLRLPARQHEVRPREHCVQRELNYAIVDEVDSILIDEARTPLIISGPAEESTDLYYQVNGVIPKLQQGAATTRSTRRRAPSILTEEGVARLREDAQGREPLRPPEHRDPAPRQPGPARPTPSSSATSTTSSRTARSSSSTSSPAGSCRAGATATACTRPSRPRKASRSRTRTRPSPRSPSRTTSACTRSWRA